jgi:hypothetical protein
MDLEAIIAEVAKRHRFVLSPDDPVLVTVTLTELAWREAARDLETRLSEVLETAHRDWAAELQASSTGIDGLSQRTEDALTAALGRVQISCDGMVRTVGASLQTQLAQAVAHSQRGWAAALDEAVSAVQQAAQDTARARHWAMIAAAVSGAIALGIVGVLTAPVWMGLLHGGR